MDVTTEDRGDVVVVRPRGDVDVATCPVLRASLDEIDRDVVVDLAAVPFMDSTGLGILAMQRRRLELAGRTFHVTNPSDRVTELLRVTGLEEWLGG